MYYRLFIATEDGVHRLRNFTTESTKELLTQIQSSSKLHNVVQVVLYELLAEQDGRRSLAGVGSFASYYNGTQEVELMENFYSTGRGLDIHNELNRLAQEQGRKTA